MAVSCQRSNLAHQQTTSTGHRFLHYSAEEFFYPHLALAIRFKSTSTASYGPRVFIITTWTILLVGAIFLFRHNSQLRWIERSLESYSVAMDSRPSFLPEPITITTTVYTTSGTRRWFDAPTGAEPAPPLATTVTPLPATVTSPTSPLESTFSSSSSSIEAEENALAPIILSIEDYALLPLRFVTSFSWPVDDLWVTLDQVMETLETVWEIFRKAYHYPLDPP
jgi:hypothetical protein